jgi:peptide/nickel transport system ATP-binding protein
MASGILRLENLRVAFPSGHGWTFPVRGVSLTVRMGEIVGLVGESGSGKTLTGLSCLKLVPPPGMMTADALFVSGIDLLRASSPLLRHVRGQLIGLIAQDPLTSLHPALPIGVQMEDALADHGVPSRERRRLAEGAVRSVGLPDPISLLRRYPHQLSGGMRQRAMIALALVNSPDFLIADEPTTALDALTQSQVLHLLSTLRSTRHMGILLISHNIGVVASLCDRLYVMYSGRIVEFGLTRDVLADPRHPYTRALLHSVPTLRGTVPLRGIPGAPPTPWNRPEGCAFHPRCPYKLQRCEMEDPPLRPISGNGDREVACWLGDAPLPTENVSLSAPDGGRPKVGTHASSAPRARGPIFELRNVVKHFSVGGIYRPETIRALDDVTLSISPGESVGIVGESGSGKSTLVRLLALLDRPTRGRILFDGTDVSRLRGPSLRAFRRRVQIVFQDPYSSLDPRYTVGQSIREALLTHYRWSPEAIERRVREVLDLVGLPSQYGGLYPRELSGGQRQRVCIARALAVEPDVLLADEPVSALDVSIQAQVVELLAELRRRERLTLIIVAHDLALLRYLCDRVVTLYLGRIVEDAPMALYLSGPRHPYAFSLLHSVPDPQRVGHLPRVWASQDPPSPARIPSGCRYHTRCFKARLRCRDEDPPLQEHGQHRFACFYPITDMERDPGCLSIPADPSDHRGEVRGRQM